MGMAASQARLLAITARKHDVEYEAQSIQNAKLQLATQTDAIYEEYQRALDATTLTIAAIDPNSGASSLITGTFNNIFSSNRVLPANGSNYVLRDMQNRVVVEDLVAQGYTDFQNAPAYPQTAQMFAMYMLGYDPDSPVSTPDPLNWEYDAWHDSSNQPISDFIQEKFDALMQYMTVNDLVPDTPGTDATHIYNPDLSNATPEQIAKYNQLLNSYIKAIYSNNEVMENVYAEFWNDAPENFDYDLFNYYVGIYNAIQQSGGQCVGISTFDGMNGDAANNSDWLKNMIECGQLRVMKLNHNTSTDVYSLDTITISADANLAHTQTTTIDKTALAKAEAKYNHDMKQIDKKDKRYDLELSKLDTERNALQTEYDSVKKVIDENIEKTFNIFS